MVLARRPREPPGEEGGELGAGGGRLGRAGGRMGVGVWGGVCVFGVINQKPLSQL